MATSAKEKIQQDHLITEETLVDLLKNKDQQALEYLYDHYSPAVYGIVLRIANSEKAAEKIFKEVFSEILKRITEFNFKTERFFDWLLRIARNTALELVSQRGFIQNNQPDIVPVKVHEGFWGNPEPLVSKDFLNTLNPEQKHYLDLIYFQGLTIEQIAEKFNQPVGIVRSKAKAALHMLKALHS
jgi:RNA polymerase sigma factor (sigma-70 family)